ncbi:NAD(P)-dependent iron-only hydrogenase catalytic subunit [Fontibacillus phaseoli]|uniref:NAD(P)-dependent iron-only hydrogenase catalytic subunit n=1 Tax=Fontibacillus phaseoli TaxID=1416533 RepID=A0A369B2U2_9BACL|nr:NADH-dependent [FeFe] hydrogenase, group A6 [Fontibacillus phaseoli]RCX14908.1 NAD(P)-dependent iron-only hydrogenase catalytic subunit [Fontibacillus phaseoli]
MDTVKLWIDNIETEVPQGTTVLQAARELGVYIPTLCHMQGVSHSSNCRVCLVESGPRLIASCTLAAEEGMQIRTNTQKVRDARKTTVELILSDHNQECPSCSRSGTCELQDVSRQVGVRHVRYTGKKSHSHVDFSSPAIMRDTSKCILCGRCVAVCNLQSVGAIGFMNRGFDTTIGPAMGKPIGESVCVNCGQCIMACPVGALQERENMNDVWQAIADPNKFVVVQAAPAVRVALGEEFGMPVGTRVTGKMVAALRRIGFDKVFDTDFGADVTIMEEGNELLQRLETGERLPLMTSCCPGWVKFVEHFFPDMMDNLSSCKSPHEMEGALIKSYFAQMMDIDPERIVVVSIMPCTAKKYEGQREELSHAERQDVDYVLTTRELAWMIKEAGIDFARLRGEDFDNPFGEASGAGVIFGATGGVAEAALRTVFELVAGEELDTVEYTAVRGMEGIKETAVMLPNGKMIRTAVAHGLGNARKLMNMIAKGERNYEFIEVMACPGGCICGGGQPLLQADLRGKVNVKAERAKAIYDEDEASPIRKSHRNPHILRVYAEFLERPNSSKSHTYLHTHYKVRSRY